MSALREKGGRPAVFFDKDGTLIENVRYNVDAARIRLYPDAIEVLRRLQAYGHALFIVSNQPGVALGYFDRGAVERAARALMEQFQRAGVVINGFYYCPHHPGTGAHCDCHKPEPGLLLRAADEHGIELSRSWMVGDILNDVEAGRRAGCRTLLVDRGNETEWLAGPMREPDGRVRELLEILEYIVPSRVNQRRAGSLAP